MQLQNVNIHPLGTKLIQVNCTKLRYRACWLEELFECTASLTVAGPQTHDLQPCLQQHFMVCIKFVELTYKSYSTGSRNLGSNSSNWF